MLSFLCCRALSAGSFQQFERQGNRETNWAAPTKNDDVFCFGLKPVLFVVWQCNLAFSLNNNAQLSLMMVVFVSDLKFFALKPKVPNAKIHTFDCYLLARREQNSTVSMTPQKCGNMWKQTSGVNPALVFKQHFVLKLALLALSRTSFGSGNGSVIWVFNLQHGRCQCL